MKTLRLVAKWILLISGAFSILAVITIFIIWNRPTAPSVDRVDTAQAEDVRFILNWCRLGDARIESVVHSYVSSRSFTGDHCDVYAIKVRDLKPEEMKTPESNFEGGWISGDRATDLERTAIDLICGFASGDKASWFPNPAKLTSDQFYLWVWSIGVHGRQPTSAQIIFAHPASSMVYYGSVKM